MADALTQLGGKQLRYSVYCSVIGIALIFLFALLCHFIYNIYLHPLAAYPGPLLYRGSEIPRLIQEWRGNTVHKWAELHEKYGEVVRIAPNQLSYISVGAWQDIYGARGISPPEAGPGRSKSPAFDDAEKGSRTKKSLAPQQMPREELVFPGDDFEFFAPAKPMISCSPVEHARHRRAVGPAFSDRALRSFEPLLLQYCGILLDRLEEEQQKEASKEKGVDIMDWFHFAMFDITSALVFGQPFGNMARGAYHEWVGRIFPGMKLIAWSLVVGAVPGLGRVISRLMPRKVVDEARRHMQSIVDMTDARQRFKPHQPDFMTYIHHAGNFVKENVHSSSANCLSADELYLNSQLLCIAGSETTASLLAGAVYMLSRLENSHHRARLVAELQANFSLECHITPPALVPSRAPFLNAVLNECLRLYPPGAINMPRTVPPGGALVDRRYVPAGSVVGIAQFAAYRSPRHWVDPLTFAPERWLAASASSSSSSSVVSPPYRDYYADDRRDVFKPFSYGPRNCVGQSLALAECRLIVARLFWRFEVCVLPGQDTWIRQRTFLSWEKPTLRVQLTRRDHCLEADVVPTSPPPPPEQLQRWVE
ncbi:cytochrome P450 [Podospora didyma]|uniref:Cytochrome P450 n=1 Tax=Podospora didyma TaxID=330526 RepID=A0AAE0KDJ7_9PEZI|nr:cytochrome P450 [Podospora didyma]